MTDFSAIIDGKPAKADGFFEVRNPANGEVVGRAPSMGEKHLEDAIAAAKAAYPAWSATSDEERVDVCNKIAKAIEDNAEELTNLLTAEQGKPLNGLGSRWEIGGAQVWAAHTATLSLPVKVIQDNNEGRVELHRKPLGVVASITPWNFPVLIAVWHILPALRTGNTVVIKPSPYTPLSTLRLIEIMNEITPPGVVNIVTGEDDKVNLGAIMSSHPDVAKVVFTGSCSTGKKVMKSAADTLKHLTLELGGNDAGIVLPDADPKAIAEGLFWAAFINNGQTCAALKRLYVHDSIHDEVVDELVKFTKSVTVGDGSKEESLLGPIQNQMQFDIVAKLVEDAKKRGNVVLGGEPGEGLFYPPTIITGLKNGDPLVDQEQFGPALPVIRYSDLDEVIKLANDSENGLGGSVWATDIEAARKVGMRMECGSVWVNKHCAIQPNAPFGGVKQSGVGTEFGQEGLEEYTDIQVVFS